MYIILYITPHTRPIDCGGEFFVSALEDGKRISTPLIPGVQKHLAATRRVALTRHMTLGLTSRASTRRGVHEVSMWVRHTATEGSLSACNPPKTRVCEEYRLAQPLPPTSSHRSRHYTALQYHCL